MSIRPLAVTLGALAAISMAPLVQAQPKPATAVADLKNAGGQSIGKATFTEGPKGVLVRIEAHGLTPGWHGLHFHAKGDCSKSDFTSAGGHVHGAATAVHGLLNPGGNEQGDLPNLYVGQTGDGNAEVYSTWVSLSGADGRANLKDADGSAVVIHASPDDHMAQPIGGAGARVACGVVK